jgi:uncharacterized protein (DUF4415 family)
MSPSLADAAKRHHGQGDVAALSEPGLTIVAMIPSKYDEGMSKRRVTLTLDEDLIQALRQRGARSLSAAANASLREATELHNHRRAALAWLAELDATYGRASETEQADNAAFLEEIGWTDSAKKPAGAA